MRLEGPGIGPFVAVVGLALLGATSPVAADYEALPVLKASDLIPASLQKGPRHEVAEAVKEDGFLTAFTVNSSFGAWEALDREMLELRVKEVYALDKLSEVSKTEVFANAFGKAAAQKATAVGHAVKDPSGTAKAIPGGIARFAKGIGRSAKGTADKVTADKGEQPPDTRTTEQKAQAAAGAAGGAAESLLISGKRREWAAKVGADPYTTNHALAQKLDDVGWAAYAGGWTALTTSENEIEAVAGDGRLVLPWSVDYMTWNAETVPVDTKTVKAAAKREIWTTGVATARAKEELQAKGFTVVEKRPVK